MKKIHAAFILVLLVMSAPAAHAFTIDGVVSDWGITPGGYGASDWTPNAGIQYALEDQNPAVDYLNPRLRRSKVRCGNHLFFTGQPLRILRGGFRLSS